MTQRFVGQSVPRKEDHRLLRGAGRFVADIRLPDMLHVAFLRSPLAHGRIVAIDTTQAKALAGVAAVFTGADIAAVLRPVPGLQNVPPRSWREAVPHRIAIPDQAILAVDKVRYVGEPVAVIVADSRAVAEDAAELIDMQLAALPPVVDPEIARTPQAALVHATGNIAAEFRIGKGDVAALPPGLHRIRRRFTNHRHLAAPIECRAVLAQYDAATDTMTIWAATQVVHWVQREVAARLGLPEARVRCIAPDVGGGFGVKGHVYPEDILIPYLVRRLGRPVRWLEDRQENLLHATHSRDDRHDAEIVFDDAGHVHAVIDHFVKDSGAYTPVGVGAPSATVTHLLGPYDVPNMETSATLVLTNKTPNAPYRGNGRPEASFVMERLMELAARRIGLDPVEFRLRNMITAAQMPYAVGIPYRDGAPVVYDSGDFPAALQRAMAELGGLEAFRTRQREARAQGRLLGLGVCSPLEGTGAGPFEGATVRIDPSGQIYVATGACAQGQGHETVFAQVAADEWGVTPDRVTLAIGDSGQIALGYGTIASRSAVNSSGAIRMASQSLRKKVFALAAHLLECAEADLELRDGGVGVVGVPGMHLGFRELTIAARPGWDNRRPPGMTGGLEATEFFEPPTVTWSYATHAGIVEIDRDTGAVAIRDYVVVHDAGTLINPLIAEGQIRGAIAQGIGGALLEEVVYDEQGQLLNASFADYLLPTASDIPPVRIFHVQTPSPLNELGIKGLGEGGVAGPPAVIANAVCDALWPVSFEINRTPIRPAEILVAVSRLDPAAFPPG